MTSNYARRCCQLWHLFRYQMLFQNLNPWLQPSLIMNCHFSATSNKLISDRKSAAEEFPLCSHTTCGMYLTELDLGLQGQLMPMNHSTIHSTHCCPVHTLLLGSPDVRGPDFLLCFQNWTSRPPLLQFYILCDSGGPDLGGTDVGGPDSRQVLLSS